MSMGNSILTLGERFRDSELGGRFKLKARLGAVYTCTNPCAFPGQMSF
jgi:hypothetical protein